MRVSFRSFSFASSGLPALLLTLLTLQTGCEPTLDSAPSPSAGSADFSRFVAIGDDYVAGISSGGLTRERQEYSLPNLLARQFQAAGGGPFVQPLLQPTESTGGLQFVSISPGRNQALVAPAAVTFSDSATFGTGACAQRRYRFPAWADAGALPGTLPHNLGIPGLRLIDVQAPGLGAAADLRTAPVYNGYLERILPDPTDARSYVDLVKASRPTFCLISVGMSDVLPFIQSGGACRPLPLPASVGTAAGRLIDSLLKASPNVRGIVLGLPLPAKLPLTRTLVSDVNRQFGRNDTVSMFVLNAAGAATRTTSTDVILSPMLGRIGRNETATGVPTGAPFGLDRDNPLRDQDVLTERQVSDLKNVMDGRGSINEILSKRAKDSNGRLIYLELGAVFLKMAENTYVDGIRYSGDPVTGGLFSLDGYTLTPRGNGVLANFIIEALNKTTPGVGFGTRLPQLDVGALPATVLP